MHVVCVCGFIGKINLTRNFFFVSVKSSTVVLFKSKYAGDLHVSVFLNYYGVVLNSISPTTKNYVTATIIVKKINKSMDTKCADVSVAVYKKIELAIGPSSNPQPYTDARVP